MHDTNGGGIATKFLQNSLVLRRRVSRGDLTDVVIFPIAEVEISSEKFQVESVRLREVHVEVHMNAWLCPVSFDAADHARASINPEQCFSSIVIGQSIGKL